MNTQLRRQTHNWVIDAGIRRLAGAGEGMEGMEGMEGIGCGDRGMNWRAIPIENTTVLAQSGQVGIADEAWSEVN